MTISRFHLALDFGDADEIPVCMLGWDASARQAVAERGATFAADPLPVSPLQLKAHAELVRSHKRKFSGLPDLLGGSLLDG
jgi:serine/threonine-protein kinase HipA